LATPAETPPLRDGWHDGLIPLASMNLCRSGINQYAAHIISNSISEGIFAFVEKGVLKFRTFLALFLQHNPHHRIEPINDGGLSWLQELMSVIGRMTNPRRKR